MTQELNLPGLRMHRFVLEADCVAIEVKGRREEIRYAELDPRSVRVRRSVFWPLVIFFGLSALPAGFFYVSTLGGDFAAFSVAGALFCVPALIGLREVFKRMRDSILFLERGDGGVAMRLQFFPKDTRAVEEFAAELRRRIKSKQAGEPAD